MNKEKLKLKEFKINLNKIAKRHLKQMQEEMDNLRKEYLEKLK